MKKSLEKKKRQEMCQQAEEVPSQFPEGQVLPLKCFLNTFQTKKLFFPIPNKIWILVTDRTHVNRTRSTVYL